MMVSEYAEAIMFCLHCSPEKIKESNIRFTEIIKEYINKPYKTDELLKQYSDELNPIISFNRERIFYSPVKNKTYQYKL